MKSAQFRGIRASMLSSKRPYGFTCSQISGVSAARSRFFNLIELLPTEDVPSTRYRAGLGPDNSEVIKKSTFTFYLCKILLANGMPIASNKPVIIDEKNFSKAYRLRVLKKKWRLVTRLLGLPLVLEHASFGEESLFDACREPASLCA